MTDAGTSAPKGVDGYVEGTMTRRAARTKIAIAVALLAAMSGIPAQAKKPGPDWTVVDERLERAVADVDGLALSISTGDGTVYEKAFGAWAIEENTGIASATKWVTAATMMTIVEDGLLSLDEPIGKHLPAFASGDKATVTLRHLLSHTSGIVPQQPCLFATRQMTLGQCADQISAPPLMFRPGSSFHYGAGAMQVAGRLAEVVTGKPWAELFAERMAAPLGMQQTVYGGARGEKEGGSGATNPHIAAGIDTTLRDYDRFLAMLHRGGASATGAVVLQPSSVAELERSQTAAAAYPTCPLEDGFCGDTTGLGLVWGDPSGEQIPYGLGTWMWRTSGDGQATLATSPGAWGTTPWIDRCSGYRAVLIMNASGKKARPIFEDVAVLIESELAKVPGGPNACRATKTGEER